MQQLLDKVLTTQKKVMQEEFRWQSTADVIEKVKEELQELQEAIGNNDLESIEDEFGDLLLVITHLSLYLQLDVKTCLAQSLEKFDERYQLMKKRSDDLGLNFSTLSIKQKKELWQEIK